MLIIKTNDLLTENELNEIVLALDSNELIIFPTETVYGIAGKDVPEVVEKLYAAKQRPENKPYSYHVGSWLQIQELTQNQISKNIQNIMQKWLPGPVTFVVDTSNGTKGIRFPDQPIATQILSTCNFPVVATSANLSGNESPTNFEMTKALWKHVKIGIDNGETKLKGDSTVIQLKNNKLTCLREGIVPKSEFCL